MNLKKDINQLFVNKFADFESHLNGQKQLPIHKLRTKALQKFSAQGLPDKHEEYKYTDLKKVIRKNFDLDHLFTEANTSIAKEALINTLEGNVLVFVNGKFASAASKYNADELELCPISEAFHQNNELVNTYFGEIVKNNNDSFASLNNVYFNDGILARVKKNSVVTKPVIIYNISDASKNEAVSFPRNLIIAEQGSQSSFIEIFKTTGDNKSFSNSITEIDVAQNANLDYHKITNDSEHSYHIGLTQIKQERDSVFTAHSYAFGGGMIRNNLHIALESENCTANMYGLYLLNGNSHVDNHTEVDHKKPNSFSNEMYKGILDDKSTGVFNGKIFVRQDAQKTNAFQSNKNILLTDEATVNTKPQLEIWADDVKCSHGCTTGQLDNEALFYLRARGIDKDKAKAMLLYAFAADILENVKIEGLKTYLDAIIAERFGQEFI